MNGRPLLLLGFVLSVLLGGTFAGAQQGARPSSAPPVKYGFIDKSGKLVIPAAYDMTNKFSEGLAAVKVGDRWGFIDTHPDS